MSILAAQLVLIADRVHLAEAFLAHHYPEKAQEALAGIHDQLVALAREVDR